MIRILTTSSLDLLLLVIWFFATTILANLPITAAFGPYGVRACSVVCVTLHVLQSILGEKKDLMMEIESLKKELHRLNNASPGVSLEHLLSRVHEYACSGSTFCGQFGNLAPELLAKELECVMQQRQGDFLCLFPFFLWHSAVGWLGGEESVATA